MMNDSDSSPLLPKKKFLSQAAVLHSLKSNLKKIKKPANKLGYACMAISLISLTGFIASTWALCNEPGDIPTIDKANIKTGLFFLTLVLGAGTVVSSGLSLCYCANVVCHCCNKGESDQDYFGDVMRADPLFQEVKCEVLSFTQAIGIETKNADNPYQLEKSIQEAQKKIHYIRPQREAFLLGSFRENAFFYTLFKRLGSRAPGKAGNKILETIFEFAGMGRGVVFKNGV
ncbi:MAG TPA: hypothetical protein VLJ15_00155 [Gammaproteobacteria bacterium]|nr:hypothetical protein [Gammaproteobacteria bacterium]